MSRTRASMSSRTILFLAFLAVLLPQATGHTWIEELRVIASNGTFTSDVGYPRGNILRTSALFSDTALTHLLPPNGRSPHVILPSDGMCMLSQSIPGLQTLGSPALKASPGDMVALRYQENGHVTIPDTNPGKPDNRGTVYIYGTTSPRADDKFLSIHKVWNAAGTGGDGRGVLLATRNYDDGWCYQVNGHPISLTRQAKYPKLADTEMGMDLWCQTDVTIPADLPAKGRYTLYWVWDWPTAPSAANPSGTTEIYTSCMDIDLTPGVGTSKKIAFAAGQDRNHAAIESQLTQQFIVPVSGAPPSRTTTAGTGDGNNGNIATPTPTFTSPTQPHLSLPAGYTVTVTAPGIIATVTVTAPYPSKQSASTSTSASGPPTTTTILTRATTLTITPFLTDASPSPTGTTQIVTDVVEETTLLTKTRTVTDGEGSSGGGGGGGAYTVLPRIRGRSPRLPRLP